MKRNNTIGMISVLCGITGALIIGTTTTSILAILGVALIWIAGATATYADLVL